jgi:lipoprotein-anchoring transpeptidase ErfK/SrfK
MIMQGSLRLAAIAALSLSTFVVAQGHPASAQSQLFWDWDGGETVGGSGRSIVSFSPQYAPGQVIVSFGDRKLYYITQPGTAISYPIAIPREQSRWQGVTNVSMKREHPSWTPTPTMLAENPRLPRWVPGGHPMNPLGVRALYLGSSTYRIHGTDAPWTIGTEASKGCIRMFNQDVLDLYPRVSVGAKVTVTYQTFTTRPSSTVSAMAGGRLAPRPSRFTAPPGFYMYDDDDYYYDDEYVRPRRYYRVKRKHTAPSKTTGSPRGKSTAPRPSASSDANPDQPQAAAEVVGSAISPATSP